MSRMVVRYRTKPEATEKNEGLIRRVFEELQEAAPEGVRYLAIKLEDGSFIHFVEGDGKAIPKLQAFQIFRDGVAERCSEPPQQLGATVIGNYRMLSE